MFLVVERVVVVRGVVAGVPVEDELPLVQPPDPLLLFQLAQVAFLDRLLFLPRHVLRLRNERQHQGGGRRLKKLDSELGFES